MKKFFTVIILIISMLISLNAEAKTFDEVVHKQKKPSAILVYADWADNINEVKDVYNKYEQDYSKKYDFLKLNIATEEAKAFNKTYYIYPNLPYIILFKDKGKTSRYIMKDCIMRDTCIKDRFDFFIN